MKNNVLGYVTNSPSIPTYVGRTYNLAVNPPLADRKARKSIVFSILASFWVFARVRILLRFFASYRGISSAKRYKTVVVSWRFAGQQELGGLSAMSLPHILCLR
jgi:hypothetical protein